MKNLFALTLTLMSFIAVPAFATEMDEAAAEATVVEMDGEDFAKIDDSIFCTVAMVNNRNQVVRRYQGVRSIRSFRCVGPMAECRQDLRWSGRGNGRGGRFPGPGRRPGNFGQRCVELR